MLILYQIVNIKVRITLCDYHLVYSGFLVKEGKIRRRRFFVLMENNQIQYFKSEDTRQPVAGTILLNCLCAVDPYDEDEVKETGN